MNRIPVHHVLIPIVSTVAVLGILWMVVIDNPRSLVERSMNGDELLSQVVALVEERYIRDLDDMEVAYDAIRGVIEGLDPYSQFYDPREKTDFQEETEGHFGGIGVSVQVRRADGAMLVRYPIAGSPADRAGIRACDRFVAVDGEMIMPISTTDDRESVISRLKGPPGTEVEIVVESAEGERRTVVVDRESIPRRSVVGVERIDTAAGIGYMMLKGFQETTIAEFDEAMRKLLSPPRIRSLIIDLRYNPGGILSGAIDLADRFLSEGVIVSTRGRIERASRDYYAGPENTLPQDLGLVVLINGDSASASEVFAGAIQDQRRGVLVGEPSYGKGVVQNVLYLNRDSVVLKVTSAAYFTPSGHCIEKRVDIPGVGRDQGGIVPDLLVRDVAGRSEIAILNHLHRARPGEDYAVDVEPCDIAATLPAATNEEEVDGVLDVSDAGEDGTAEEAEVPAAPTEFDDPQLRKAIAVLRGDDVFQEIVAPPARSTDGADAAVDDIDGGR